MTQAIPTSASLDVLQCLDEAESRFRELTAGLTPADLDRPTPCDEWDVRALVSHTIGAMDMYSAFADGAPAPDLETVMGGRDLLGADPQAAIAAACARSRRTWTEPGVLDRELETYWGPWSGDRVAAQSAFSTIIHGWDLATALDKSFELPQHLLDLSWQMAEELAPVLRDAGVLAEPVAVGDDATPTAKLLAFMGRDPSQAR